MDDPRPQMQDALKKAMLAKDNTRRDVLRMTLSAFKQVEIDERRELSAEDAVDHLAARDQEAPRQCGRSAQSRARGHRRQRRRSSWRCSKNFCRSSSPATRLPCWCAKPFRHSGASSPKEMGKVMGVLMPKVKGKADGKLVNEVVRDLLNNA